MTILKEFGRKTWGCDVAGEVFIETGTGYGDSLLAALESGEFRTLHSIEIYAEPLLVAREKVNNRRGTQVFLHSGSSVDVLPRIIDPSKKTVFWLDAHEPGCPLLDELKIIVGTPWQVKPVILIDDYAAFMSSEDWWKRYGGHLDRSQWPTWGQIYDLLGGPDYRWDFIAASDGILYIW